MEFYCITVHNDPEADGPYSQMSFTRAMENISPLHSALSGIRQTRHPVEPTYVLKRLLSEHDFEVRCREIKPEVAEKRLAIILKMEGFTDDEADAVRKGGRIRSADASGESSLPTLPPDAGA